MRGGDDAPQDTVVVVTVMPGGGSGGGVDASKNAKHLVRVGVRELGPAGGERKFRDCGIVGNGLEMGPTRITESAHRMETITKVYSFGSFGSWILDDKTRRESQNGYISTIVFKERHETPSKLTFLIG